jgi:hypothetical protein
MRKSTAKVKYVKFSPEEMAYEPPKEVNFKSGTVFRDVEQWRQYLGRKRGFVKLDPDVAAFFRDDQTVNEVLRRAMGIMKVKPGAKRRKSA